MLTIKAWIERLYTFRYVFFFPLSTCSKAIKTVQTLSGSFKSITPMNKGRVLFLKNITLTMFPENYKMTSWSCSHTPVLQGEIFCQFLPLPSASPWHSDKAGYIVAFPTTDRLALQTDWTIWLAKLCLSNKWFLSCVIQTFAEEKNKHAPKYISCQLYMN